MPQKLPMDVVCGEITHQNNAQPGPCGTHSYRAIVSTSDGVTLGEIDVPGSVESCWPNGLHVNPIPVGRGIIGVRFGRRLIQWFYREIPVVGPCNSPSMMMTEEVLSSLLLNPAALKALKQAMEAV